MQIMDPDPAPRVPIFKNMPILVLVLAGAIIVATLVQFFGGTANENSMFASAAIIGGPEFSDLARPLGDIAPLFLHVFLHGDMFHLAMNMAMLLALGPIVANGLGPSLRSQIVFLVFFFVCALAGALAQMLYYDLSQTSGLAIGASSAISGLLPAMGYLKGGWREAARFSLPWLLINIVLALTGGIVALPLAWQAHLGGLAAGFLFPAFKAATQR